MEPYADKFWDAGCDAPQIKRFKADVKPKTTAQPSARRPFRWSEHGQAQVQFRFDEFRETGKLYDVPPEDAGEWASPAFIMDKVRDI